MLRPIRKHHLTLSSRRRSFKKNSQSRHAEQVSTRQTGARRCSSGSVRAGANVEAGRVGKEHRCEEEGAEERRESRRRVTQPQPLLARHLAHPKGCARREAWPTQLRTRARRAAGRTRRGGRAEGRVCRRVLLLLLLRVVARLARRLCPAAHCAACSPLLGADFERLPARVWAEKPASGSAAVDGAAAAAEETEVAAAAEGSEIGGLTGAAGVHASCGDEVFEKSSFEPAECDSSPL
eukprot:6177498-Pleurochrysis_carterae.AAC.1